MLEPVKNPREGWEEAFKNADLSDWSEEDMWNSFPNEFDLEDEDWSDWDFDNDELYNENTIWT